MQWQEIDEENPFDEAWINYWMDEVDPRQTKRLMKTQFDFEQACGGDY